MGSMRFVFLGVLFSLILAAVLIPGTGNLRADAQEQLSKQGQLSKWCSSCHSGTEEKIRQSYIYRYRVHAGLEAVALVLDLLGALYMLIVVLWAFGFWALYAVKYLLKINQVQPETNPFLPWILRALNLLIAGEIIGSISTTINPSYQRIAVLLSVVIIRGLISLILQMEHRPVR